jgi:tetraacyldisaccharide 4'-kinase
VADRDRTEEAKPAGPDESRFIERVWYGDDLVSRLTRTTLIPFERVYGAVVGARDILYDAGLLRTSETALPTISIGNVTVGGTGKTPIAAWIAQGLAAREARPAIVMRGYGDDEPAVHRAINPSFPVIVSDDRTSGIRQAARAGATVAVLDDGFQHRQTRRETDLVLVSADRWTTNRRLLPAGPFREPLRAVRRATLIIVTRKAASDTVVADVHETLARVAEGVPRVSVRLSPDTLVRVGDGDRAPLSVLAGADVRALIAIGDPRSFVRQLADAGARVHATVRPDHHHFRDDEIARFVARVPANSWAVCTLKDAVKLQTHWPREGPSLWYVSQLVTVERGVGGLERVLDDLVRVRPRTTPTAG